jgi:acyl carrier protein
MKRDEAKLMLLDVLLGMDLITPEEKGAALQSEARDIQLGELGIDSMAVVDLCMGVEEKTGRELRVEEIIDNPTIDQLAGYLAAQAA